MTILLKFYQKQAKLEQPNCTNITGFGKLQSRKARSEAQKV